MLQKSHGVRFLMDKNKHDLTDLDPEKYGDVLCFLGGVGDLVVLTPIGRQRTRGSFIVNYPPNPCDLKSLTSNPKP